MSTKIFTLNGSAPKSLNEIAREVVLDFATKNPSLTAHQIRDIFVSACKGVGVAHVVETAAQYHARSYQKSWKRSADEITIPSGDKLYVSTQWHAKKPGDDFFRFRDVVHREGWGKIV